MVHVLSGIQFLGSKLLVKLYEHVNWGGKYLLIMLELRDR